MAGDSTNPVIAVSYSLPHIVSASVAIISAGYISLLYINIYKWKAEEFGKVYSFYFISTSICQFVFSLILQFVVTSPDEITGLRNCKIFQISNISLHSLGFFSVVLLPILKIKYNSNNNALEGNPEKSKSKHSLFYKALDGKQFIFLIYFSFLIHGYGFGTYDICDRILPTYITRDSTYLTSTNELVRGLCNFSVPLIIILLNKTVGKRQPEYIIYLGLTTFLLVLLVPISVLFYIFTQRSSTGSTIDASKYVPSTSNLDYPVLFGVAILRTTPPILYLTFPAIIQYISTHLLDDDADFRVNASTLYLVFFFLGSVLYKAFSQIVSLPKKTVSYLCIASFSLGYLLLFPYKCPWNKKGVIYYVVIAIFNIFSMIFHINCGIITTNQLADDNHKKYRWLILGLLYVFKNTIFSITMKIIYVTYGKEQDLISGRDSRVPPTPSLCAESAHEGEECIEGEEERDDEKDSGGLFEFRRPETRITQTIWLEKRVDNIIDKVIGGYNTVCKAACDKIKAVRECINKWIVNACTHICQRISAREGSATTYINCKRNEVCRKIQNVHDCIKKYVRQACENICNTIKKALGINGSGNQKIGIAQALEKVCTHTQEKAKSLCEKISDCIKQICGHDCKCDCCQNKDNECCNDTSDKKCKCNLTDTSKGICTKCCVIQSSRTICNKVDEGCTALKEAVTEGCKALCNVCDNLYSTLDKASERPADKIDINISCNGGKYANMRYTTTTYKPNGTKKTSTLPAGPRHRFKIIIRKIYTDLKNLLRCFPTCKCPLCKKQNGQGECTCNNTTDQSNADTCKCIKCQIIKKSQAIRGEIDTFKSELQTQITAACQSICDRLADIATECNKICQQAHNKINKASATDATNQLKQIQIPAITITGDTANCIYCKEASNNVAEGSSQETPSPSVPVPEPAKPTTQPTCTITAAGECQDGKFTCSTSATGDTLKNKIKGYAETHANSVLASIIYYVIQFYNNAQQVGDPGQDSKGKASPQKFDEVKTNIKTDKNDLESIKDKFKNESGNDKPTYAFGSTARSQEGAAMLFYNAINRLKTDLIDKADSFKGAIDTPTNGFKALAEEFNNHNAAAYLLPKL